MTPVTLTTDRLILRLPDARDIDAVAAYHRTTRSRWTGGPKSRADSFRAYASVVGHWHFRGYGMFAIELRDGDGAACGLAGPWFPDGRPVVELGYNLWSEEVEGRGIAYEAAVAARDWSYRTFGWTTLVSCIDPRNGRSRALAERLGAWDDTDNAPTFEEFADARIYRHPGPEALQ